MKGVRESLDEKFSCAWSIQGLNQRDVMRPPFPEWSKKWQKEWERSHCLFIACSLQTSSVTETNMIKYYPKMKTIFCREEV